jgi:hypothetical protein
MISSENRYPLFGIMLCGVDISLDALLSNLKLGRCPLWGKDATYCELRCTLAFTDIGSDNPPDVPPSAVRPRLLK